MQTPRMLSTVRKAAPVLTDAGVGVGVAVLVLAASAAGVGPPWISSPRPLDVVAVGLIGVVAGALALRRRYPMAVLVVLNAVALAWAAGQYPGPLIMLAPLIACYTVAALRGWRWGLAGAVVTALTALVAIRVAFGAAEPAGISGIAVWMAATAGAAGTAVGYYRALLVATRAQLAREAQTREEQARRRAAEERLRIARELHDVLGHTMATISVHAGVGIHLLQQRPAQAVEALTTIKQISDQGLTDVPTRRPGSAGCVAGPGSDGRGAAPAHHPRQRPAAARSRRSCRLPDHPGGTDQRLAPRRRPHRPARPALRTRAGGHPDPRRRNGRQPGPGRHQRAGWARHQRHAGAVPGAVWTVHRRPAPRWRLPGAVRVTHPRPGMMTTCARQ
jgi:Histidine kinase